MKILIKILFLIFIIHAGAVFSQSERGNNPLPNPQNLPPVPDFSWVNACKGSNTCFINETIRGQTYTWTVTDTSSVSPTTYYTSTIDTGFCFHFLPGTYSVTLAAYNNHYVTTSKLLTIDTTTKADFSFILCSNHFVNNSRCAASYYWNFGDGTSSTQSLPNHQYADTGHYEVSLIAYNGSVSDTLRKQIFVSVNSFANSLFTYTVKYDTLFVHALYAGAGTNYYWSWDDGTYSSGVRDTFYVYKDSTASYFVSLTSINSCGPAFHTDSISIVQQLPAQPNFSFNHTCFGDTTCFVNQSLGGITYTWTVKSTGHNPSVIYTSTNNSGFCFQFPSVGDYIVILDANNFFYTATTTQTVLIDTLPVANFSFIPCSNKFVNLATCSDSFYWNFGDGSNSSLISPFHQYADTGYYHVTFVANKGSIADTIIKQIHVGVVSFADAAFTTSIISNTLQTHASFNGTQTTSFNWSFGDGTNASGKDTMHVYADTISSYIVKLTVTNLCGPVSNSDTIHIIVPEPPAHLEFNNSNLAIVPNPVSNGSYVEAFFKAYSNDKYLCEMYDGLGQKIFESYFNFEIGLNGFKINTSNFAAGIYILVLQSGNSFIRDKFYIVN